jgi:hypothetical protein
MTYTKESRFTMPDGTVFRTRSTRRYVVAWRDDERWHASYRTDTETKAMSRWRSAARNGAQTHVVDTHTGNVIR